MLDPHRHTCVIDAETRSLADLPDEGRGNYFSSPGYEPLIVDAKIPGHGHVLWELPMQNPIPDVLANFLGGSVPTLVASHGDFDFYVMRRLAAAGRAPEITDWRWRDTMALCAYHSLPVSLQAAAIALKLPVQKLSAAGKKLIKKFCIPDASGRFQHPEENMFDWRDFIAYCQADVDVCDAILRKLPDMPPTEWALWRATRAMNERGVPIDLERARFISTRSAEIAERAEERIQQITGGIRGNQSVALAEWATKRAGREIASLAKAAEARGELADLPPDVQQMMTLRGIVAAKATAKSEVATRAAVPIPGYEDQFGAVLDTFRFCGAQTGRWAGRSLQPQNFKRPTMSNDDAEAEWDRLLRNPPIDDDLTAEIERLGGLMRSMVSHPSGLAWADFSGIELRNAAILGDQLVREEGEVLSGPADLVTAFRNGLDFYSAFAPGLYAAVEPTLPDDQRIVVTPETAKKTGWRGIAKTVILGAQYAAGPNTIQRTLKAGSGMDFTLDQASAIAAEFRSTFIQFPAIWRKLERAVFNVLASGKPQRIGTFGQFEARDGHVVFRRASGSCVWYQNPRVTKDEGGRRQFTYDVPVTNGAMLARNAHPGLLTEHVVSSVSRDILGGAMLRAEAAGLDLRMSIHDELVVIGGKAEAEALSAIMLDLDGTFAAGWPMGVEAEFGRAWGK